MRSRKAGRVVAEVFNEDSGEVAGCGRGELTEGLGDFVPLDNGLAGDDAAEVERAVGGRKDIRC